jgi:hypothetical protein
MNPCANLFYVHTDQLGYGRMGVNIAAAVERQGVTVYDDMPMPEGIIANRKVEGDRTIGLSGLVCWMSVPVHAKGWWEGQKAVCYTMWESTYLPPTFREPLHEFDQIIVPSQQNVELFSQYHDNVSYVPLGIDPTVWHYTPRQAPNIYFDFLIGGSGERKGTMLAYDAFLKVFGNEGSWPREGLIPRLIMKSPQGKEPVDHDRVLMISGRLPSDEEVALYESAHVYLQPSRGEGCGLQPLQAMAQGIPTILTNAHGHAAFADLGLPISAGLSKAGYFTAGDAHDWWEPNFDELCDQIRWVYDNYTSALERAEHGAAVIADEFTWDRCAERFIETVGPEHLVPFTETTWRKPELRRYPVVTNRDYGADIAGISYQWTKGQTYYEVADVKRIMWENGVLDPVCLEGNDPGLHPRQIANKDSYSGAHSYCRECQQRLNSRPTAADDLLAEADACD